MVALSPLAGAGWQFFDSNGNPLSGGLLYTYLANTTTPATTYTASSGINPNSNPIVLDSAGRVPYEIWQDPTLDYKYILKTSTGTDIWTKDNIPGMASAADLAAAQAEFDVFTADLAAQGGADLVGADAAYSFALLRGVGDKLLENRSFSDAVQGYDQSLWAEKINLAIAETAAAGLTIYGNSGEFPCESPVYIVDNADIACEENCVLQKAYNHTDTARFLVSTINSTGVDYLGTADGNLTANNWSWTGGTLQPIEPVPGATPTLGTGGMTALYGFFWNFQNVKARDWSNGQGMLYGGGRFLLSSCDFESTVQATGTGCYRNVWAQKDYAPVVGLLRGISGDDVFQAVPLANVSNALFGKDIYDLVYDNCVGQSVAARLMIISVAQGTVNNLTPLPSKIIGCGFRNVRGRAANRAIVVESDFGTAASTVDKFFFDRCQIDGSLLGSYGTASDAIRIVWDGTSSFTGATNLGSIGRGWIEDTRLYNNAVDVGLTIRGGANVFMRSCEIDAQKQPWLVDNLPTNGAASTFYAENSTFTALNNTSSQLTTIGHATGAWASDVEMGKNCSFVGVSTSNAAIRVNSGSLKSLNGGLKATKNALATGTYLISQTTGTTVDVNGYETGTVDNVITSTGTYRVARKIGSGKVTFDFGSLATNSQQSTTITVTGAAVGDQVTVWASGNLLGTAIRGVVTAANTVTLYQTNLTGGNVDVASMTYSADVNRIAVG